MKYPNSIALIDARIALLEQARDILTASSSLVQQLPRRQPKRQRPRAVSRRSKTTEALAAPPEVSPAPIAQLEPEPQPEPVRLPFVAPRKRSSPMKRAVPAEKPSALGAHLPTGPVFVSPARLREEEARRRDLEPKPELISEDKPAKVNQILRKWLQEEQADTPVPGTIP